MEVAGIVIGGVSAAALFETVMSAFQYIETGKKYGSDYQKAALRISVLELRLSRWAQRVHFSDTAAPAGYVAATAEQSSLVEDLLEQIEEDLENAEKKSKRYALSNPSETDGSVRLERLGAKFRDLSLKRQKKTSLVKKARWALQDKRRLDGLIEDITTSVNSLETMFPAIGQASSQLREAVIEDVEQLVLPAEVEEADEVSEPVIAVLQEITAGVDDQLREAVDIAAQRAETGDSYRNVFTSDEARAQFGDFIAKDYAGPNFLKDRPTRYVDNVRTTGKARIQIGNSLGGKHVFDD